jgi:threonine/homoserine/homoserine lactone efflux protein
MPRPRRSPSMATMPDPATLAIFAAATAVLLLVPGPSVLFIVARTLEHGRRGGLISMAGVETGALLHVAAASAGISALVAASPAALVVVKLGGAAYLLVLGVRALRGPHEGIAPSGGDCPRGRLFRQGLLVDALNPKTAMFFLAFLPQFVDPAAGGVAGQTLVLGLCFVALATLSDGGYALLAGAVAERLRRSARARKGLRRMSGAAYVGLGALTGLSPA